MEDGQLKGHRTGELSWQATPDPAMEMYPVTMEIRIFGW
jgi:hypothetical protein